MNGTTEYIHAIEGRLRIKVAALKRSPDHARRLEESLREREGIQRVQANPITGNLLVHYAPQTIDQGEVLEAIFAVVPPRSSESPSPNTARAPHFKGVTRVDPAHALFSQEPLPVIQTARFSPPNRQTEPSQARASLVQDVSGTLFRSLLKFLLRSVGIAGPLQDVVEDLAMILIHALLKAILPVHAIART